jgi:hypothetical protein
MINALSQIPDDNSGIPNKFSEFKDSNIVVSCFNEFKRLSVTDFNQFIGPYNNIHFALLMMPLLIYFMSFKI